MKSRIIVLTLALFAIIYVLFLFKSPVDPELQNRIRKVRLTVDNVNSGGCGYTAKYVKQYLDGKGIESTIVQIDSPFNHFMVEADGTYIDKNGFFSRGYPPLWNKTYRITLDSLQTILNDSSRWNKRFTRSDTTKLRMILLNN